jgi:hypothetical protein
VLGSRRGSGTASAGVALGGDQLVADGELVEVAQGADEVFAGVPATSTRATWPDFGHNELLEGEDVGGPAGGRRRRFSRTGSGTGTAGGGTGSGGTNSGTGRSPVMAPESRCPTEIAAAVVADAVSRAP